MKTALGRLKHPLGFYDIIKTPILSRMGISPDLWLQLTNNFGKKTSGLTGSHDKAKIAAELLGYQRVPRVSQNRQFFS